MTYLEFDSQRAGVQLQAHTRSATMSVSEMFSDFISNLAIRNTQTISARYGEITAALNKRFRDTESKEANTLQVGSFGRKTGIDGISDLDMLYLMPKSKWESYDKAGGQYDLLRDAKEAILARYPKTKVKVDRLVVTVTYADFHVEVQPVFEQDDGSYKYPDTKDGGSWKVTKPREEMAEVAKADLNKNANLRPLCKMARAWKNKHGVAMGGLLLDTLAYNFLMSTTEYDNRSYLYYDRLSRDFFKYLSEEPDQAAYAAPGSRQRVKVKKRFQRKAKKAYELCLKAIDAEKQDNVNEKWKKVFGRPFPAAKAQVAKAGAVTSWANTEEFIEDQYPTDIRWNVSLDCEVQQDGFRTFLLKDMLRKSKAARLKANKTLMFQAKDITVPEPYELYWKILNRGPEAQRRNCLRGQIVSDYGRHTKRETTTFIGDHVVECYCVKDGVVVAKARVHVPIDPAASDYE